ncbi:hypothetical protein VOLCADRAFT_104980 [Volvox carteri f. nagariensis]|uniref:Uncharacterized protein n=1 Tax=Volvox carteri f. nagariensis TaxID=3068 RepID=D8TXK8_VOLCA|nr:uncharacterized protein VOLCADRAFT_104980 [Volvox carteri f. nagariensis]EFJ47741.1 hypothetical protein VOLCADRAFT_104980 [Volvox carteri f. nagariensis]|eukprot:XP_002951212.1 hypothetical protein VOLCADRAFT_104980 [Volvox carteri f. nagariensis]
MSKIKYAVIKGTIAADDAGAVADDAASLGWEPRPAQGLICTGPQLHVQSTPARSPQLPDNWTHSHQVQFVHKQRFRTIHGLCGSREAGKPGSREAEKPGSRSRLHGSRYVCMYPCNQFRVVETQRLIPMKISTTFLEKRHGHKPEERRMSDHNPVSLHLASVWRPDRPPTRKPKPTFLVSEAHRYTDMFYNPEAPPVVGVRAVVDSLRAGQIGVTQAVDTIERILLGCFGDAFRPGPVSNGKAAWWNHECAAAKQAMLQYRSDVMKWGCAAPAMGHTSFQELRRQFNRAKRNARRDHRLRALESFIATCKRDAKTLWQRLNEGRCILVSVDSSGFLINVEDTDMRKVFLNTNPRKIATFLTEVFDERQQRALEPHGS